MSYTTIETVKKHILEKRFSSQRIEGEASKLTGLTPGQLKSQPVIIDSEKVKAIVQNKPDFRLATFGGDETASLNKSSLAPDSVVVASNGSLSRVYIENIDFLIDCNTGMLNRISSGAIPAGSTVAVWFLPYRIYVKNEDYRINYVKGEIVRMESGDIFSGQTVVVDYGFESAGLDDEVIENAISEANDQVLNFIDPANAISTDRSLVVGETYLTMALICRIKAMENIGSGGSSSWVALADQYKREGYLILNKFANMFNPLTPPKKA
jgi:hypothetical protein